MNHQPFETWIFTDDPINPEEQERLIEHQKSCKDCRRLSIAMDEIENIIVNTPSPAPAPGFTRRWHERLALHRQAHQKRQMLLLTMAFFGLASLLSLTIVLLEWGQTNWFYVISQWVANFSLFASRINKIWVVFRSINKTLPIFIPIMIVFGVGSLSASFALILTWFNAMVKLYQPVQ